MPIWLGITKRMKNVQLRCTRLRGPIPLSKRKSHSSPYLKKGAFWLGSVTCSLAIDVLVHPFAWSSVDADAAFTISEHLPIFGDATRQL